jgi:hypothetical protein
VRILLITTSAFSLLDPRMNNKMLCNICKKKNVIVHSWLEMKAFSLLDMCSVPFSPDPNCKRSADNLMCLTIPKSVLSSETQITHFSENTCQTKHNFETELGIDFVTVWDSENVGPKPDPTRFYF